MTQICVQCHVEKPLEGFAKAQTCANGFRKVCKTCRVDYNRELNKKIAKSGNSYAQRNERKVKDYQKQYRDKHKGEAKRYREEIKEKLSVFQRERRKIPQFNISGRMSARMRYSLRNNKHNLHWEDLVGYTLGDLISHLKTTIPDGYMWEDYEQRKHDFHIDHVIPVSAFNFSTLDDIDFQRCWSLKNLRLIPAIENRTKNAKINRPFQPVLAFGDPKG